MLPWAANEVVKKKSTVRLFLMQNDNFRNIFSRILNLLQKYSTI